ELDFVNASAKSAEVNELVQGWASEKDTLLTVAICLDNDTLNVTRALTIAGKLQRHNVPVLVRMEEDAGLASLLVCDGACNPAVKYIRAFGQIDRVCALSRLLSKEQDRRARRLHERYVADARKDPDKSASDPTLLDWEKLPESYKDSNRQVSDHLPVKLRAIGISDGQPLTRDFTKKEIEILARMEHARWMAERQLAGWRYAPGAKCEAAMTNPNLLPWSKLDRKNKDKDRDAVREMARWLKEPSRGSNT
ncbi:MAG: hypothetical protein IT366_17895, partial [Candidatus Hydrogenedentes bacterium]|nr:hypothetical protein [Candidatus Hydrogenedentota bacterium]